MKILSHGEVTEGGSSVFQSTATLDDDNHLTLTFKGALRLDNPYRYLSGHIDDLQKLLPEHPIKSTILDFAHVRFINSNAIYPIMDIVDSVYSLVPGPVTVRRIADDDWQREIVPIILNLSEDTIASRTTFEDVKID